MKLLIDTHTYVWLSENPKRIGRQAERRLEDGRNEVYLSIVSVWETAIKIGLGKLTLDGPLAKHIERGLERLKLTLLPLTREHAFAIAQLPHHHRDPFDRMLIAQAIHEDMAIVTADVAFDAYSVRRIW